MKEKKKKRCAMRRKERLRNTLGARAIKGRDSLAKEITNKERERSSMRDAFWVTMTMVKGSRPHPDECEHLRVVRASDCETLHEPNVG